MDRDILIKQLQFRSHHRGINEMDQILGSFAADGLSALTDDQLAAYQQLLAAPDWDAFAWITGKATPPAELTELIGLIDGGKAIAGND